MAMARPFELRILIPNLNTEFTHPKNCALPYTYIYRAQIINECCICLHCAIVTHAKLIRS